MLVERKLLPEVKKVHLDKCADCLAKKQNMPAFRPRPPMSRKNDLKLEHMDVCQVDAKSHAGAQYFVTFIDDYSRKLWVSTLKTKDQVLFVFKELQVRAERESGQKLTTVRKDNGGEYQGKFKEYCRSQGIWLEYTVSKTPTLNGMVERMNQAVMERV